MTETARSPALRAQPAPPRARVLRYPGVDLRVHLEDAPEVEAALGMALRGWRPDAAGRRRAGARMSRIRGGPGGYAAQSSYLAETLDGLGLAGATCTVIADLAQDFFETRPGCLALHCAAVRIADRLVALTGPARAGKSTLAARLTMEPDMAVFCDDILPLDGDGRGWGLGVAPRLRLPLPERSSAAFRTHVARVMGPRDDRYGYVCAPGVAPHGSRAALRLLLILDRRAAAPARLHAVREDEALHHLLSQNMSDLRTADDALARLTALLTGVTCLRLVYSDLEGAVALIRAAARAEAGAGAGTGAATPLAVHPALPETPMGTLPRARLDPAIAWARHPDAMIQTRGTSAFLWKPGTQVIWHMNTLALAVWTLLEIPGSAEEIAQVLAPRFSGQRLVTVTADVNALLQSLAAEDLIQRPDPA